MPACHGRGVIRVRYSIASRPLRGAPHYLRNAAVRHGKDEIQGIHVSQEVMFDQAKQLSQFLR